MGTIRRIYKNMAFLSVAEFVSKILQFLLMVYAARLLDKNSFGKFSFALSLSFIAIIAADLGISMLLIREIARNKNSADKYFINALVVKLVFAFVIFILLVAFLNLLNYPRDTRNVVYIIWLFSILSTFTDLFYSIFRAFESMAYDASIKIARMLILASAGFYVLYRYKNVFIFSWVFVVVEILMVLLAYLIASNKFIKFGALLSLSFMRKIVKKALPFGLAFVFSSVYFYVGSVILSKMRGDAEVATYSVAYNLAFAFLFVPLVYTNAIYPVMSRYYKNSKENLKFIYTKSFKYLYIIGLPISVITFMLADRIIVFFYGREYISSIISFKIMSWYIFLKFLNTLMGSVLSSIDRQEKRMLGQGVTAIFNLLVSILLISEYGYIGASISILITEIFLFVLYYFQVSKYFHAYNFTNILWKPAIIALIAAFAVDYAFTSILSLGLILTLFSYFLIYGLIIFATALDKKDLEIFSKMFKGKIRKADSAGD